MEGAGGLGGLLGYAREGGLLHGHLPALVAAIEWTAGAINLFAILILVVGAARFAAGFALAEFDRRPLERAKGMNLERVELGRYILAGLEVLIVSDILHTAVSLAFVDLVFLGLLVLVRSVISFFLERELEAVRRELGK